MTPQFLWLNSMLGSRRTWQPAWGASPARLEDLVAPTAMLVDKSTGPPTLASHDCMPEGQEYLQWVKVHSSQKVATVGVYSYQSG